MLFQNGTTQNLCDPDLQKIFLIPTYTHEKKSPSAFGEGFLSQQLFVKQELFFTRLSH